MVIRGYHIVAVPPACDTLKGILFFEEPLAGGLLVSLVILGACAWFFNTGHLSAKH
jgi:hypothetical protein